MREMSDHEWGHADMEELYSSVGIKLTAEQQPLTPELEEAVETVKEALIYEYTRASTFEALDLIVAALKGER